MFRYTQRLFMITAALTMALMLAGCGASTGGSGGGGDGGGGGGGGGGGPNEGDTSAYAGHLAWTLGVTRTPGIRVRDLASVKYIHQADIDEDSDSTNYFAPTLSADGGTLGDLRDTVITVGGSDQNVNLVELVDLGTGDVKTVPTGTGDPDTWRMATPPSVTGDGGAAVFVDWIMGTDEFGLPTGVRDPEIVLWSGSGQPSVLTDLGDDVEDSCPLVTADGSTVYFLSDRDRAGRDIYRLDVASRDVERLTVTGEPLIDELSQGYPFGCDLQASDDGSALAFGAELTDGSQGLFVMNTTTGVVTRTDESALGHVSLLITTAFALSGDGGTMMFTTQETSPYITRLYAVDLDAPGVPHLIKEDAFATKPPAALPMTAPAWLALSGDGGTVAALLKNYRHDEGYESLVVMRYDKVTWTLSSPTTVIDAKGTGSPALGIRDLVF